MDNEELIAIDVYCQQEGLDISFVEALDTRGLITMVRVAKQRYLDPAHMARVERLARLHFDLEINLEGVEAIDHLLQRMENLRRELEVMRQRLRIYESED